MVTRCRVPAAALLAGLTLVLSAPALRAGEKLIQRAYPVADLVVPVAEFIECGEMTDHGRSAAVKDCDARDAHAPPVAGNACTAARLAKPGKAPTMEDALIKLITNTVRPRSWVEAGGDGRIAYCPTCMGLVVNNTPEVHQEISEVLAALRRLQDVQIVVETRIVAMPAETFEKVRWKLGVATDAGSVRAMFLDAAGVERLLEAVQGDAKACVTRALKVTVLNDQTFTLQCGESHAVCTGVTTEADGTRKPKTEPVETGFRLTMRPTASADRRHVRLDLQATLRSLNWDQGAKVRFQGPTGGSEEEAECPEMVVLVPGMDETGARYSAAVPDGRTVMLGGWKRCREERCESGPPVLRKIPYVNPYVNRTFKNVGCGRTEEVVLLLVTPRIVVRREEELPCPPAATCPAKGPCCPGKAPCCPAAKAEEK